MHFAGKVGCKFLSQVLQNAANHISGYEIQVICLFLGVEFRKHYLHHAQLIC